MSLVDKTTSCQWDYGCDYMNYFKNRRGPTIVTFLYFYQS